MVKDVGTNALEHRAAGKFELRILLYWSNAHVPAPHLTNSQISASESPPLICGSARICRPSLGLYKPCEQMRYFNVRPAAFLFASVSMHSAVMCHEVVRKGKNRRTAAYTRQKRTNTLPRFESLEREDPGFRTRLQYLFHGVELQNSKNVRSGPQKCSMP